MVCYLVIFTKDGFMRKVKRFFQASLPLILFNDNRDKTIEKAFRKNKNHRILKSIDTFRKKNEQTKVFITFQMHLYDFLCSAFIVLFFITTLARIENIPTFASAIERVTPQKRWRGSSAG